MEVRLKMPKPTAAPPGSREKLEVIRLRVERGEELWHPKDPRIEWEHCTMKSQSVSLKELWEAYIDYEVRCVDSD